MPFVYGSALRRRAWLFFTEHTGSSIPRHNQHGPGCAPQNAFTNGSFLESAPTAPPVGTKNDDIDLASVCMKNNDANGIALLLLDLNLHTRGLCSISKLRQVLQPLGRPRRVPNVRRYDVKDE
jgi:hypothetical protein